MISVLKNTSSQRKKAQFANRADPDEAALNELPHQDLHCLSSSLSTEYVIAWMNFFLNFADPSFNICFLVP